MRIWLDVEQLDDVGKLEESVRESACFCLFLSKGYFASKNCALPRPSLLHTPPLPNDLFLWLADRPT